MLKDIGASSSSPDWMVFGDTVPNLLALKTAILFPPIALNSLMSERGNGFAGTRSPIVFCPPVMKSLANSKRLRTIAMGPGKISGASVIA